MNNFLEIYTRLKMKTDCKITLTYYSSYGYKENQQYERTDGKAWEFVGEK